MDNNPSGNPAKNKKTVDDLFKITKAQPPIYYVPLSDEEAQKRKETRKHHHNRR